MTDDEIVVKVEAIAAVLAEYLVYYQPIYTRTIEYETSHLPRAIKKKQRRDAMKAFHDINSITRRFAKVLEHKHDKEYDGLIDKLHDSLNEIQVQTK